MSRSTLSKSKRHYLFSSATLPKENVEDVAGVEPKPVVAGFPKLKVDAGELVEAEVEAPKPPNDVVLGCVPKAVVVCGSPKPVEGVTLDCPKGELVAVPKAPAFVAGWPKDDVDDVPNAGADEPKEGAAV